LNWISVTLGIPASSGDRAYPLCCVLEEKETFIHATPHIPQNVCQINNHLLDKNATFTDHQYQGQLTWMIFFICQVLVDFL